MRKFLFSVLVVCMAGHLFAQDFSLYERGERVKEGYVLPYRILYPEEMQSGTKYPLFLFLHGMGKRGTDNQAQLSRGADLFLRPENRRDYPCVVLYPQAPKTGAFVQLQYGDRTLSGGFSDWSKHLDDAKYADATTQISPYGEMVLELVEELIGQGIVDPDRIYLAGASMGAYATYHLLATHPDLFAAAAPMGGGTDLRLVDKWAGKVPVWIVHGSADDIVWPENDRRVAARLQKLGVPCRYSEYPGVKHNCWDTAFLEPDFMAWFFSHVRKKP